ncbi:MAG: hypothetical protein AB7T49_04285 [Oligoflexales bacterium]
MEFLTTSPKTLQSVWNELAVTKDRSPSLATVGWQWRLGWIRRCLNIDEAFCRDVLQQALEDRALVVRAEAATIMGQKFEDTKDAKILAQLERAYKNPRNLRNGKPMFIQRRILFSIHQVGGKTADGLGERLARSNQTTQDYWRKL